jgi:hypothetical protein
LQPLQIRWIFPAFSLEFCSHCKFPLQFFANGILKRMVEIQKNRKTGRQKEKGGDRHD